MVALAFFPSTKAQNTVESSGDPISDRQPFSPELLRDGDIVLQTGTDMLSELVLSQNQDSQFSHVGMLVKISNDWLIIHSAPEVQEDAGGVHMERLDTFASRENTKKIAFYRVNFMDGSHRQKLKEYLQSQLGKPFDYRFEYSDDSSHYCTELVLKALDYAGIQLEPLPRINFLTLNEGVILPNSLTELSDLKEISHKHLINQAASSVTE